MTELEKIAYTKSFIDKLSNGINPIDNTPIPEEDVANQPRLRNCFSYVSDILNQIIRNGGIGKVEKTIPFSITQEQIARIQLSQFDISASELSRRIDDAIGNPQMKSLSVILINQWLIDNGFLYNDTSANSDKPQKLPTERGQELGITTALKEGRDGQYIALLYNTKAQRFIIDHIYDIMATKIKR